MVFKEPNPFICSLVEGRPSSNVTWAWGSFNGLCFIEALVAWGLFVGNTNLFFLYIYIYFNMSTHERGGGNKLVTFTS
jgi:hypothetical protein